MMDLATIRDFSRQAARKARKASREPRTFTQLQIDVGDIRDIPNLGTYCPPNWVRVSLAADHAANPRGIYMGDNDGKGAFFVDTYGFASPGEPAISIKELTARMKPGLGYAMVEEGQFQVKVGVFAVRTDGRRRVTPTV